MNPTGATLAEAPADRYRLDREIGAGGMATVDVHPSGASFLFVQLGSGRGLTVRLNAIAPR